ncbi:succinyldiaminopimelate transaminase [Spiribacter vilamensis]|uniref:Succinyldiaminopimelate aminotransferase n=1 Tax=Spiribacter vilamensis TaxID=531306 RepID=A0A4Q8CZK3_9GAMM|nr:succinyldiaminopimelate transaminase [Spiribacter vilamensis]RZU98443.1 succinyldiaminopimelate aminotransferase [Spiribacter vilamensis]TVO60683.1 succinyldiaminopimelate transaminase [Spiribacter vilamensis]
MASDRQAPGQPGLARLQPYPFERLRALLAGIEPPSEPAPVPLSIGEPKHPVPASIASALKDGVAESLGRYPASAGLPELREAIAGWLGQRFRLDDTAVDPDRHILPAAGTREALFAVTQALLDPADRPDVFMPNPFYQIYEGAALLAGGRPRMLNTDADSGLPVIEAVSDADWARCGLIYLCSPGNPTGRIIPQAFWQRLFRLQARHGFVIAADECYSELYRDESHPPLGLLQACAAEGRHGFEGCLVFHSLSKRSNVPGLRSGFIAGDARLIQAFRAYRTYQGCALPLHVQKASVAAWSDETHVRANRDAYREKFRRARAILADVAPYREPEAGFYIWLPVPGGDDEAFTRALYAATGITVLPGRYLSRPTADGDPGAGHVRMALVADTAVCEDAMRRIRQFIEQTY